MNHRAPLVVLAALSLSVAVLVSAQRNAHAQQPTPSKPQPSPTAPPVDVGVDEVVRVTTNLVQFDAVVTDNQGRLVTDLRPEEFEVLIDGKRQPITNFSFISNVPATQIAERPVVRPDKNAPPIPTAPLRASQVHRAIALVADDLGTSFVDLVYVREALRKYVDEQMQPGDLVAIIRTGGGGGALQQFTTDKRLLYRAIERVRWNPSGRSGVSAFAPSTQESASGLAAPVGDTSSIPSADEFRDSVFTVGTLGALNYVLRGMKELPGRKSVILFSDGFSIYPDPANLNDPRDFVSIAESMRRLVDLANRASVVIYTIDARGLPVLGVTAADNITADRQSESYTTLLNTRSDSYRFKNEGMDELAHQTGGFFVHNSNDLGGGVRRILEDQKGYYLIGFRPDDSFFRRVNGRSRFNSFEVKVTRKGLHVRTRSGFYGFPETKSAPVPRTRFEQILSAISSPLASGDIDLRITSLLESTPEKTAVVDSLMHIDMSRFKLEDEADGWKKAVMDVVAVTFGEDGQVVDEINRTETVHARGDSLRRMIDSGAVYLLKIPIKKPGAYQLRVAVRDALTARLGAASQYIEVPDLKKDRLALSGIFMKVAPAPGSGAATQLNGAAGVEAGAGSSPLRDATMRVFRQGARLDFTYNIYNARASRPTDRPRLLRQFRLFRDGQSVYSSAVEEYDPGQQTDPSRLRAGNQLKLDDSLTPGDYVLQVIVTDAPADKKPRTATQWIDFEIVK
jgi:VWFA-related protein